MKKILFNKILLDCLVFFFISIISTSVIIWVFQAVNFLDIIVEDGRDYIVYLNYSLLNFPKIISKIFPFALFFSFFYILTKYETNNELIIFWNFGVHKITLINFFLKFSILIMFFQLILTIFVVPNTQNLSRSLIRDSNVDFFESFVKPKKFNDNIKGLTIYADEKDKDGNLKNIYLKKDTNKDQFQITVAKKGIFKTINGAKVLVLYDGQTINSVNKKITNFSFSVSDFTLSIFGTDTIITDKMQETPTIKHIKCLNNYFNKDFTLNKKQKEYVAHNCSLNTLSNLLQELYKRFIVPLYIPILIITSLLLILISKENIKYNIYKIGIFLLGIFVIIFSEISLKFVGNNLYNNIGLLLLPIIIFLFQYMFFKIKLKTKIKIL
jgi:lipopolysaccharide export system permease protein